MDTVSPANADLYCNGEVEVPAHCNPYSGLTSCGTCGRCYSTFDGNSVNSNGEGMVPTEELILPGETGFNDSREMIEPDPAQVIVPTGSPRPGRKSARSPSWNEDFSMSADGRSATTEMVTGGRSRFFAEAPQTTELRSYSPHSQPVYQREAASRPSYQTEETVWAPAGPVPELIGPIGYDVSE